MRVLVAIFSVLLIAVPLFNAYANDNKTQLYDQCIKYKQDESYCTCAMGKPYEELSTQSSYTTKTGQLERHLKKLEDQYDTVYEQEITKGGLNASQIERICDVVDEYYDFLDEIGMPYKVTGPKKFAQKGNKGAAALTSEQRQALALKRTELNKKIHDLNHEYQRGGAMGSFSGLGNGVCVLEHQINWTKEEIEKNSGEDAPVITIQSLLAKSRHACSGQ